MLYYKLITNQYLHESVFIFKEKAYFVHSFVRLTEYGQRYLGSYKREAIVKEHFKYRDSRPCWTYEYMSNSASIHILTATTDEPPEKIIEEVIYNVTYDYYAFEELIRMNIPFPNGPGAEKQSASDFQIPEVRTGWIVFILASIALLFFKDWYVKSLLFAVFGVIFGIYRQSYKNAYTTYTYPEYTEIAKIKQKILYERQEIDINTIS